VTKDVGFSLSGKASVCATEEQGSLPDGRQGIPESTDDDL